MQVLIDHLNAIVVGVVLLAALLALQLRERINSVDEAMRHELQTRGESVMLTLGQDLDNLMTAPDAGDAGLSPARCRIERLAAGPVESLTCPGFIETAPGVLEPAIVEHRLLDAGTTYEVGDSTRTVYTLQRTVTAPSGTIRQPIGDSVVGFDVELFGATGARVVTGDAPLDLTTLRVEVELAHAGLQKIGADQASERMTNVARFAHTYRPPNLTYLERTGSGGFAPPSTGSSSEDDGVFVGDTGSPSGGGTGGNDND